MNELQITEIQTPGALDVIQRAEIDVQIMTAKRFPRELSRVKQTMLSFATLDQETAEACFYSLPRGGKNIQGPSVRLAEIAVSCFKNLRAGSRIVQTVTTGATPHVVVQAVAHDLENNVAVTIEKRRRIVKKKSKDAIDEDDINLAANAGSAIAFRDAVFKVVPMALIKPVFESAKKVAVGDAKTLSDRRAKMVDSFAKMGVQKERILLLLEKKSVDDIDLVDLETLIGLFNAIKDGAVSIDESFPSLQPPAPKKDFNPTFVPAGGATDKNAPPPGADENPSGVSHSAVETVSVESGHAPRPENQKSNGSVTPARGEPVKTGGASEPANDFGAQQKLQSLMEKSKVRFDKFRDWASETGRLVDADSFADWSQLPVEFCKQMLGDPKSINKCIIRCNS